MFLEMFFFLWKWLAGPKYCFHEIPIDFVNFSLSPQNKNGELFLLYIDILTSSVNILWCMSCLARHCVHVAWLAWCYGAGGALRINSAAVNPGRAPRNGELLWYTRVFCLLLHVSGLVTLVHLVSSVCAWNGHAVEFVSLSRGFVQRPPPGMPLHTVWIRSP